MVFNFIIRQCIYNVFTVHLYAKHEQFSPTKKFCHMSIMCAVFIYIIYSHESRGPWLHCHKQGEISSHFICRIMTVSTAINPLICCRIMWTFMYVIRSLIWLLPYTRKVTYVDRHTCACTHLHQPRSHNSYKYDA